jgi:DNA mismatch repair protein MSH5
MEGTHPASGIAVLAAALRKLSSIGCQVVCTTHFLEIFSLNLLNDGHGGMSVLRMGVHVPDNNDENDDGDAVPLFKLEKGVATTSAGLVCAKMAGLSNKVLDRSKTILAAMKNENQLQPIAGEQNANSFEQARARVAIRAFMSVDDWNSASDDELRFLEQKISAM